MRQKKGSSLLDTKIKNRICIKETIYKMEPITRTDIATELGLTLPTITTNINEMIEEGILQEMPLPEEMLTNATGRKPVGIGVVPDAGHVIGVELGAHRTTAVKMDLRGNILEAAEIEAGNAEYPVMLKDVEKLIRQVMGEGKDNKLIGVGIGLPGFIDERKGVIRYIRERNWVGQSLAEDLQNALGLQVFINNNVRMRAIGFEMEMKRVRPDSFVYFYISKGIACPFMARDYVLSGYTSGAGELGHTIMYVEENGQKIKSSLEELAGEDAIINACQQCMLEGKTPILKSITERDGMLGMKQILEAQALQDGVVNEIVCHALEYLGIEVANIVNFVSPDFIVLDGYILKRKENLDMLRQVAYKYFWGINEEEVKILYRQFDHMNGAKGAAYAVVRRAFLEKK